MGRLHRKQSTKNRTIKEKIKQEVFLIMIKKNFDKKEYLSPFNTVGGNEGDKCYYPTRLDTYGKGCFFNCKYCYAKSLLDFRGYWHPEAPSPSNLKEILNIIKTIPSGEVVRLGGMVDCFQPIERIKRVTYHTIKMLNAKKIHYLIVTKSDLIIRKEYLNILDPHLAHIQVSIPSTDNKILNYTDNAPSFERRKKAVETLYKNGFDVSVRLSPYLFNYVDYIKLNSIKCDKILIEFLRVNPGIIKNMGGVINETDFTYNENNYKHLSLSHKLKLLKPIKFKQISICEDVSEHYDYFTNNINYNPDDCCNLKLK